MGFLPKLLILVTTLLSLNNQCLIFPKFISGFILAMNLKVTLEEETSTGNLGQSKIVLLCRYRDA